MRLITLKSKNNEIIIDDKELKLIIKSLNNNDDCDISYFLSNSLAKLI